MHVCVLHSLSLYDSSLFMHAFGLSLLLSLALVFAEPKMGSMTKMGTHHGGAQQFESVFVDHPSTVHLDKPSMQLALAVTYFT